ncbi:MAG: FtsX-like permease family protein [Planctomycetota bacterium]
MIRLVWRQIFGHKVRSLLTIGAVFVGVFLLCLLRSVVVALNAGVDAASAARLMVQSSVSLFVSLPISYKDRILEVEGVEAVSKWQWFGGYYQDQSNFFAQFAVDPAELFEAYPEIEIDPAAKARFLERRNACIVGEQLMRDFGGEWEIGKTIPMIGALFQHPSGGAWEFELAGTYRSTTGAVDNRTMFFQWDFFEKTMDNQECGVFVLKVAPGSDVPRIMAEIDALYENGPQKVRTTTEKEFQRQFVTMIGAVPLFVSWIGGGAVLAILMACVNTMLLAARQQVHDVGILKALGFTDGTAFQLMLWQSLVLCTTGGVLGVLFSLATERPVVGMLGTFFPGYEITPQTIGAGIAAALGMGLVAGALPAFQARKLQVVQALRGV